MTKSVTRFILCLLAILSAGCASVFDARTPPYDRFQERCDRLFAKRWDRLHLSTAEFPVPKVTPYDGTNNLLEAYSDSYAEGVKWAIQIRGYGPLIQCLATNDVQAAKVHGWKNGRYAVSLRAKALKKEIHDELWEPFLNDHYERSGISFHLPRVPFIQPRWSDTEKLPDGTLKSVHRGYYARGYRVYHGVTEEYYPDGQIKWRSHNRHGESHGTDLFWHSNGQLAQESPYYRGEEWHGVLKTWYENGLPESEETWVRGKQHGPSTYWNEDGSLSSRQTYSNGVMVAEEPQQQPAPYFK